MSTEASVFRACRQESADHRRRAGHGRKHRPVPRPSRLRRRLGRCRAGTGRRSRPTRSRHLGGRAVTIAGDVLDDSQIPRIVAEAEAKLGGLDVMVSIVGAAAWGSLLDTTAEIWDQQMQPEPALLLPDGAGGRAVADPPRQARRHRRHRLGGWPAGRADARRLWRRQGRPDQPGADDGGGVGAAPTSGSMPSRPGIS